MILRLTVALFLVALIPVFAGQKEKPARPAAKPPAAPKQQPPRQQQEAAPQQGRGNAGGNGRAGEMVQRLAGMSPEERERALAKVPPEQRQAVMRRLQNFQKLP